MDQKKPRHRFKRTCIYGPENTRHRLGTCIDGPEKKRHR